MAFLEIDGKQYEAKANFKFERTANKKYPDEKDNYSGLEKIYQDLMSYKISALLAFWDCATSHYAKQQPSVSKIEEALSDVIDKDEDGTETEQLFKDAFQVVDNSGFFRLQLNEFWKQLEMAEQLMNDEKDKDQAKALKEIFLSKREELNQ